jgi:hypothetical protein
MIKYARVVLCSAADPHHFYADLDTFFHFDADPDPTFLLDFDSGTCSLSEDVIFCDH